MLQRILLNPNLRQARYTLQRFGLNKIHVAEVYYFRGDSKWGAQDVQNFKKKYGKSEVLDMTVHINSHKETMTYDEFFNETLSNLKHQPTLVLTSSGCSGIRYYPYPVIPVN